MYMANVYRNILKLNFTKKRNSSGDSLESFKSFQAA